MKPSHPAIYGSAPTVKMTPDTVRLRALQGRQQGQGALPALAARPRPKQRRGRQDEAAGVHAGHFAHRLLSRRKQTGAFGRRFSNLITPE